MLVLSRKPGESVYIDGMIKVTVLKLNGGRVRLGIEAPKHVCILRSELNDWSGYLIDDSKSSTDVSQGIDVAGEHSMIEQDIGSGI